MLKTRETAKKQGSFSAVSPNNKLQKNMTKMLHIKQDKQKHETRTKTETQKHKRVEHMRVRVVPKAASMDMSEFGCLQ